TNNIAVATPAKPDDLVDISLIIPDAVIAMRYAIANNFVGRIVYPVNRCLLRRAVATQLAAAALTLRADQRRLWLWDCYRPASIQKEFWKLMPDPRYVAKPTFAADGTPRSGSRHSRGAAVDIGLANQAGELLPMPSAHDEFSRQAHRVVAARSPAAADYALLNTAMTAAGFTGITTEWWHYDSNKAGAFAMADTPLTASEPTEPAP
nr:D-alanyl-D-alanine carboxypeptidase family protein [Kofleriaceae bacterium]